MTPDIAQIIRKHGINADEQFIRDIEGIANTADRNGEMACLHPHDLREVCALAMKGVAYDRARMLGSG